MKLQSVVITSLLIATMSIGLTSFISTGLTEYGVQNNVDQSEFKKLQKLENATSIATKASERSSNVESKSNFFNLPGVVKTGKLTFEALGLWNHFFTVIMSVTGLNAAPAGWPALLITSVLGVMVSFIFVKRFF